MTEVRWEDISVEETGPVERTQCDCCRAETLQATGDLQSGEEWLGFFSVRWSDPRGEDHPPLFTVYVGDWSEAGTPDQRWAIRSYWRDTGLGLDDWSSEERAGITGFTPLDRADLLDTPFAATYWAMIDAIIMKDGRLEHFRQ
ncbi:hypothetical protein [Tropicibacter sp. S64]|uniref:hypothetical protein n=1 Tax=Tropicibacter sp. S64 TaxID=3415122 RepID=UPI003C7D14E6